MRMGSCPFGILIPETLDSTWTQCFLKISSKYQWFNKIWDAYVAQIWELKQQTQLPKLVFHEHVEVAVAGRLHCIFCNPRSDWADRQVQPLHGPQK